MAIKDKMTFNQTLNMFLFILYLQVCLFKRTHVTSTGSHHQ